MNVPHDRPSGFAALEPSDVLPPDMARSTGAGPIESESPSVPAPGPYSHPEAYDIINAPGTPEEVNGLERLFARVVLGLPRVADARAARGLTWLEPCSGSGRFVRVIASRLAQAAAVRRGGSEKSQKSGGDVRRNRAGRVIGIDLDPGMVAYARGRIEEMGLDGHAAIVRADIRRFTPLTLAKACASHAAVEIDAAFCLHNSIRHMTTERDLFMHLRAVARVLSKRGVYAVGVELTPPEQMMTSESVFVASRAGVRVREVFNYLPPEDPFVAEPMETVMTHLEMSRERSAARGRSAKTRSRTTDDARTNGLIAEWSTTYHLRCWSLEDWLRVVEKAGLREIGVFDSWGVPLNPSYRRYALRVLQRA